MKGIDEYIFLSFHLCKYLYKNTQTNQKRQQFFNCCLELYAYFCLQNKFKKRYMLLMEPVFTVWIVSSWN